MPAIDLNVQPLTGEFDVCIIGAGAAGITLALELSDAGQRVLLCEGGGWAFSADSQDAYVGELSGEEYFELITARMRYFGGTTNHWAGYCHPLQPVDFAPRTDLSVPSWPIAYSDIAPHYVRAGEIVGLPSDPWNYASLESTLGLPKLLGAESGMESTAFRWPSEGKFRILYLQNLTDRENVLLAMNSNLVDLEFAPGTNKVTAATVVNYSGDVYRAVADRYVIGCGGMENAKLLLNIADGHYQFDSVAPSIGKYFMEHLCYYNSAFLLTGTEELAYLEPLTGRHNPEIGSYQWIGSPTAEARAEHGIDTNVSITLDDTRFFAPDDILNDPITKGVTSLLKGSEVSGSDQIIYCYVRAEQLPNPDSNITLTNDRDGQGLRRIKLNWSFDERDFPSMVRTVGLFAQTVAKQGLGRVAIRPPDRSTAFAKIVGGYHHMGSTRMSESPAHGVVDANCRVHGIDNLYMAGSSVFSTGGWANPTINVVAFAVRLADHLRTI